MTIDTAKWRACAPLLSDGGCEAVRELCDEIDRLTDECGAAVREADRWRHGMPIEGDYVCPADLERDTLRAEVERLTKELDEARREAETVRADAVLALALDQEQIDANANEAAELHAVVQRESAWVNERDGVIAHLSGVLYEVERCTTIENARTFAATARANLVERRAGLWAPGPGDDAADWSPGHHRDQSVAERIAAWLEGSGRRAEDAAGLALTDAAADIRSGAWRTK